MSSGDLTLDELMTKLREPLAEISGLADIMWVLEDPVLHAITDAELNDLLAEDIEFEEERAILINEIKTEFSSIGGPKIPGTLKISESFDIDLMSSEDILEKLRCKCREFQDKFVKKAERKVKESKESKEIDAFGSYRSDSPSNFLGSQRSQHSPRSHHTEIYHHKEPRKTKNKRRGKVVSSDSYKSDESGDAGKDERTCKEYLSVKEYALFFIDDLLQEAEERVNDEPFILRFSAPAFIGEDTEKEKSQSSVTSEGIRLQSTEIASQGSDLLIKNFTPKAGRLLILEIIHTWNLKKNWNYCIDFISEDSDTCADFYIYQVNWSLPTMSYPVPQVLANVFFRIEVSRVKPKSCPVSVTYNFESERYKFSPDDDIQHEIFLDNIMKSKLDFFKSLRM